MSFDEIFDLTAGVYFNFYNILLRPVCSNAPLTIEIGQRNKHLYAVVITSLSF